MIDRVTTGRCNHDFFRGGSKVKVNIGNDNFWVNGLKRSRPPDVVVTLFQISWLNKRKAPSENATIKFVPHPAMSDSHVPTSVHYSI